MAATRARFWPVSLLIDADCDPSALEAATLWPSAPSDGGARALFHEAVHYWQNLSQSFLVALADEDWQRLLTYEITGTVLGPGAARRTFDSQSSSSDWSARDLHECLARFWDLIAVGPRRVLEEEWATGRATALRDVRELHRRRWSEADLSAGAWDEADLALAMLMVAGEYASPFLAVAGRELAHAVFLFPWLAHFALQTRAPAEAFDRFVRDLGPELAQAAADLLETPGVAHTDLFELTMLRLSRRAFVLCEANAEEAGDPVRTAAGVFAASSLRFHPVYSWSFRGPLQRTADALARPQPGGSPPRGGASSGPGRSDFGTRLLDRALATPGLPGSRTLLLASGAVPPSVRCTDGAVHPLAAAFGAGVACRPAEQRQADILWQVTRPARESDLTSEDLLVAEQCVAIQRRWEAFVEAARERES